ncbi:D-2-hydroxyacid dehydrogenase family protein [Microbacterium sediminis]|uniref:Hydroxyacid dehydrogenase n=1 Tax=Microbacterium sediminis TaxID=904291 RepID=A0A1B9NBD3_9MICO|nr:D-2-hydroxyacid dehydrogenase family protein [Microbacterium sediminis]OCG73922.1 hydroxyacid dehydrogenase [Microbacterium sediminis]QBR74673.1 D-2-hydroxyacid dehydrogenase family protein [Microbacterium sediminis]
MRIVVLDDYQRVAPTYADWARFDADVAFFDRPVRGAELTDALAGAEVIVAMRERTAFPRELLERLPDLRLLVTTGARNDAIDLDAARRLGVTVCGTEAPGTSTPELAWGLILAVLRSIPLEDAGMRTGGWQTTIGGDLAGRRLGIVGLGRLGERMARIGQAFGMDVVAWSLNLDPTRAAALGVTAVTKDELFSSSDVVTIHYKLGERSRGLVGAAEIALMTPSAILVNTSRGPIVDTDALIRALEEGRIRGAGIDVFDEEPLPADHPLRSAPRTVLTPHLGYVTDGTYRVFYPQAVEAIAAWRSGTPIRVLA